MANLKEMGFALARIALGIMLLIGSLIIIDIFVYLSATDSIFNDKVAMAFSQGYDDSHAQSFEVAYQEAHSRAYWKGYNKGYELSLVGSSEEPGSRTVMLHKPSYKQLMEFLARDKTDTKPYLEGEFVSLDFAVELNNNAELEGIRAGLVIVSFPERSHGMTAFETMDKGLIFIEPQSDTVVEVVVGKAFGLSAGTIGTGNYNNTVVEIQIIW